MLTPDKIKYLIVHCAATNPSQDIGVKEINEWHLARGWNEIGYHFVIRRSPHPVTSAWIEAGRTLEEVGAHVKGMNSESYGVCLVGGIDYSGKPEANFSTEQFQSLYYLLKTLKQMFPKAEIAGHNEFAQKACPSFNVKEWWSKVNSTVYLPIALPTVNKWDWSND